MASPQPTTIRVNDRLPVSRYLIAAKSLLLEAEQYEAADNGKGAYNAYFKLADLIIASLPRHKDFQHPSARQLQVYGQYKEIVRVKAMPRLEALKSAQKHIATRPPVRPGAAQIRTSNLSGFDWGSQQLPAVVAQPPARNVEANSGGWAAPPQAPAPPTDSSDPFAASSAYAAPSASVDGAIAQLPSPPALRASGSAQHAQLAALPSWMTDPSAAPRPAASHAFAQRHALTQPAQLAQASCSAPAAPSGAGYPRMPDIDLLTATGDPQRTLTLPPQEIEVTNQAISEVPDLAPGAVCDHRHPPPSADRPAAAEPAAEVLPASGDMRRTYISTKLMHEFLQYAKSNTKRNVETCGILGAKLTADNTLNIVKLVIPKQSGDANSVEMSSEEELVAAILDDDFLILGWIHTHPQQTCFLSSIDVHTHCSYQVCIPEAVAIVMAPTDPRQKCGFFRLTTPGGLGVVQSCERRGFHPHDRPDTGQEIYELCGHVYLDESLDQQFHSADLR